MGLKSPMSSVILCCVIFAVAKATPLSRGLGNDSGVSQGNGSMNALALEYLGMVEGKAYFIDTTNMNWFDANTLCTRANLRLATIVSQAQMDFLKQAMRGRPGVYTNAIGSETLSMLSWGIHGSPLNNSLFDCFEYRFPDNYQMRSAFMVIDDGNGTLSSRILISLWSQTFGALCETI